VTEVVAGLTELFDSTAAGAVDAYLEALRETGRAKMTLNGWTPRDADDTLDQMEADRAKQFDAAIQELARKLRPRMGELERQLAAQEEASKALKVTYPPTEKGSLDRMAAALERMEFRQRMQGRTLAEIATIYARTADEASPHLVALIEEEHRDGFGTFQLRTADSPERQLATGAAGTAERVGIVHHSRSALSPAVSR
jgi:hypothetical protein